MLNTRCNSTPSGNELQDAGSYRTEAHPVQDMARCPRVVALIACAPAVRCR